MCRFPAAPAELHFSSFATALVWLASKTPSPSPGSSTAVPDSAVFVSECQRFSSLLQGLVSTISPWAVISLFARLCLSSLARLSVGPSLVALVNTRRAAAGMRPSVAAAVVFVCWMQSTGRFAV